MCGEFYGGVFEGGVEGVGVPPCSKTVLLISIPEGPTAPLIYSLYVPKSTATPKSNADTGLQLETINTMAASHSGGQHEVLVSIHSGYYQNVLHSANP